MKLTDKSFEPLATDSQPLRSSLTHCRVAATMRACRTAASPPLLAAAGEPFARIKRQAMQGGPEKDMSIYYSVLKQVPIKDVPYSYYSRDYE